MRTKHPVLRAAVLCGCLFWSLGSFAAGGPIPNPEFDLEPDMNAKLLKEKSRQGSSLREAMAGSTSAGSVPGSSSDCGSVNINSNTQPASNSGIASMFGKTSTTIITGPVINAARCN